MSRKKKEEKRSFIAYLSTQGDLFHTEKREAKQLRYLSEYAKAHNISICSVVRRNGMGQAFVNEQWKKMVYEIQQGKADGILIVNTEAVSSSVPDAFYKLGQVYEVGGMLESVDEGRLYMPVRKMIDGKMVVINERH